MEVLEMVTNKSARLELASRVEAAAGPDRELDARIWCALNGKKYADHSEAYSAFGSGNPETQVEFTEPPKRTRLVTGPHTKGHAKPVTASLDAAMSLVPEGLEWHIDHRLGKGMSPSYASLWGIGARDIDRHFNATGKTPALALCAAALRTLAKEKGE